MKQLTATWSVVFCLTLLGIWFYSSLYFSWLLIVALVGHGVMLWYVHPKSSLALWVSHYLLMATSILAMVLFSVRLFGYHSSTAEVFVSFLGANLASWDFQFSFWRSFLEWSIVFSIFFYLLGRLKKHRQNHLWIGLFCSAFLVLPLHFSWFLPRVYVSVFDHEIGGGFVLGTRLIGLLPALSFHVLALVALFFVGRKTEERRLGESI